MAAKYRDANEDMPCLEDFIITTGRPESPQRFKAIELKLLDLLDWKVDHPDICLFLESIIPDTEDNKLLLHISMYIAEISLFYPNFIDFKPSVL